MSITRSQFVALTRNYMDAETSERWTDDLIITVGGTVMQNEWSGILNQNQYYRFASRAVTTDSTGRIAIADLSTGLADARQYFYRVLTGPTDGNNLWRQTDLRDVPLGTTTNYQNPYALLYYLAGPYFQLLPVQSGLALTVDVNWTPASISQLDGDASVIDFPEGYEMLLVWTSAGTLLLKGGAEAGAASTLFSLADDSRKNMLGDLARLTVRPTSALFLDSPGAWGG